MSRPEVNLDVDGVLLDFLTPAYEIANKMFGFNFKPEQQDVWDMCEFMRMDAAMENAFYEELKKPGFHAKLQPYPGTVEAVAELRRIADVTIVTAPMFGQTWCFERWDLLHDLFKIPAKYVIHGHLKEKVFAHAFVDDKPEHADNWAKRYPAGKALLWHQHYTAKLTPKRAIRVMGWPQVLKHVEELRV